MTIPIHSNFSFQSSDIEQIVEFAQRCFGLVIGPEDVRFDPISGGLESSGVFRCSASGTADDGTKRSRTFVVKVISAAETRELHAYQFLAESRIAGLAPQLFAVFSGSSDQTFLMLEWITPQCRWPWRDSSTVQLVLKQLAALHSSIPSGENMIAALWNYEDEILASTASTMNLLEEVHYQNRSLFGSSFLNAARRIAASILRIRKELMSEVGVAMIHGDVHSGNVVITSRARGREAVLLDWARWRRGSSFEDVCSWLQSLRCWEPEALKYHDTLLQSYLRERGWPSHISRRIRDLYWLAGASNAFAGALRYHLASMYGHDQENTNFVIAARGASDWLRIIRRADLCWRA